MKKIVAAFLAIICAFSFASIASARLVGDVNSDGKTNSSDALIILQFSVGKETDINEKYADVNSDGKINSSDALIALQIAVGSYKGDYEVEDETLKKKIVDPIMSTGEFTLKTETNVNGKETVATTMFKGKDFCVETKTEEFDIRVLVLSSETYLVMPDFIAPGVGIYMPYEQEIDPSIGDAADAEFVGSEEVTVDGEKLICETYKFKNGKVSEYYFKDDEWVMLVVKNDSETTTQKILDFKKGVDSSKFSLKGLIKVSL